MLTAIRTVFREFLFLWSVFACSLLIDRTNVGERLGLMALVFGSLVMLRLPLKRSAEGRRVGDGAKPTGAGRPYRRVNTNRLVPLIMVALVLTTDVGLLAQFGGDPITSASYRLMDIIVWVGRAFGVVGFVFAGVRVAIGRADYESLVGLIMGGALLFGAKPLVTALFGVTP